MTLLGTAGVVLIGLVLLAGTLAPLLVFGAVILSPLDGDERRFPWQVWAGSAVVSFVCIVAGVYLLGQTGGDEAAHCAAGTRYVEQNRVVGKSVTHEWACVPA